METKIEGKISLSKEILKMKHLKKGLLVCWVVGAMCLPAVFGQNGPVRIVDVSPFFRFSPWLHLDVHVYNYPADPTKLPCRVDVLYWDSINNVFHRFTLAMKNNFGTYSYFSGDVLNSNLGPIVPYLLIEYKTPNGVFYDDNNGAYYALNMSTSAETFGMAAPKGVVGGNVNLCRAKLKTSQGIGVEWDNVDIAFYAQTPLKANVQAGIFYSLDNWKSRVYLQAANEGPVSQMTSDICLFRVKKTFTGNPFFFKGIQFFVYFRDGDTGRVYRDDNFGQQYELSKTKFTEIW